MQAGGSAAYTGGDQVLLRKYSGGSWGPALAITDPGLDVYRTAVAIDGKQRTWVFWSQNTRDNFEIFARSVAAGRPGPVIQISKDPGSDIDPVAATDSKGNVWVAWQGWRNGRARIFASSLDGDRFTAPTVVSQSAGNEWNPAIAASQDGRVTVAWDSYRNGNYDIFMRTASGRGSWGPETAVAATARYEAYPSLAYDSSGRLWVAYEEGGRDWGKDFGAYDTSGIALYQGRSIRLTGIEPGGARVERLRRVW
jgi:beta-xylosidase